MSLPIVVSIISFLIFVTILATPKLPNALVFFLVGPLVVFTGTMKASDVFGVMASSSLFLMMIIGFFSHLMKISTLDMSIGTIVNNLTKKAKGKHQETYVFFIIFVVGALFSTVLQNVSVAMAMLPALFGIARTTGISRSKMVLFIIYATTLGGAVTLIGTPTNVFASGALEAAGIQPFGMLDFAWVALPIAILGGAYMILMHNRCASYDDTDSGDLEVLSEVTDPVRANRQKSWVSATFGAFVMALVVNSLWPNIGAYFNPYMVGFFGIGVMFLFKVFTWDEIMDGFPYRNVLFTAGILLVIRIVSGTGLGAVFGDAVVRIIGDSTNLYFITSVLFIGAAIVTQFMNNMATAGALAPIGISIAEAMGADPRAIVMAIAIGAGCGYLTPMASGTNQTLIAFSELQIQDFVKFGWPLVVISFICCVLILPQVFPFFP
ncbi:MAG TPA: hypothetical protein GX524_04290 [Firmicutes bacterium]|jgi:sodium-dependent dicarboxylate transporter 2/3/5|nr:hypothetical protein [Bacillota bacterium]